MNTEAPIRTAPPTLSEQERREIIEKSFGALADLHEENLQIIDLIEEAFAPETLAERKRIKTAA